MRLIVLFFLLTGTLSINAAVLKTKKLKVLSTIKPIHLLVMELAGNKIEAMQLIPDNASPHEYSFKPSDISKIKKASLIFRIDEHFESILGPVLENYSSTNELISLADSENITLLSIKSGEGHKHKGEHLNTKNTDFHIWTSPRNVMAMANAIAAHLMRLDVSNKQFYEKNLETFIAKIQIEIQHTKEILQAYKREPYLVFNNTWRYYKNYYGLQDPIVINRQEGQSGNIRAILKIRNKIKTKNIHCIFADSSVNRAKIETIIEGHNIKNVELDVLAKTIPLESGAYFKWLSLLNRNIVNCLGG